MGITFSITIPEPLEIKLGVCAKEKGVSRSRFICDILSKWEEELIDSNNGCLHQDNEYCRNFNIICKAPRHEALTCSGYIPIPQEVK